MTAIHLINRLPSRILGMKSPLQLLEAQYPTVRLKTGLPVKIFGCIRYVYSSAHQLDKWSTKSLKCVFVGYSTTQKGYNLYHPLTKKYLVSKDVVFDERQFFYKPTPNIGHTSGSDVTQSSDILTSEKFQDKTNNLNLNPSLPKVSLPQEVCNLPTTIDPNNWSQESKKGEEPIIETDSEVIVSYPKYYERRKKRQHIENLSAESGDLRENVPENKASEIHLGIPEQQSESDKDALPIALKKGIRSCTNPVPYAIVNYLNYNKVSPHYHAFLSTIQEIPIPRNAQEAMENWRWKEAMDKEMSALLLIIHGI